MTQKDYLIISEPYPVVCNGESEDMIHKGLTLRMVAGRGKSLQQENVRNSHLCQVFHLGKVNWLLNHVDYCLISMTVYLEFMQVSRTHTCVKSSFSKAK